MSSWLGGIRIADSSPACHNSLGCTKDEVYMKTVPVYGYENYYSVSDCGRVFSLPRTTLRKDGKSYYTTKFKELSQKTKKSGYKEVCLRIDGKNKSLTVHRIVCLSFFGVDKDRNFVNHKNGIRADNRIENLEWCTISENNTHAYKVLKRQNPAKGKTGKLHHQARKVIATNVKTGKKMYFDALMDAKRAGFMAQEIYACCRGFQKTHYGMTWQYA